MSDFFRTSSGGMFPQHYFPGWVWRALDRLYDHGIGRGGELARQRSSQHRVSRSILLVGVEVPTRSSAIHETLALLQQGSRHRFSTSVVPMGDRGKFENIQNAISRAPSVHAFDWLAIVDDDISFAPGFLDDLVLLSEAADLSLAMPAHAFWSYASYRITRRQWGSLARQTNFVEIGPLTLVKADVFDAVLPFPHSRWCYGIDLVWAQKLNERGRRMGIVDGAVLRHLRPVAGSYNIDAAVDEGEALLRRFNIVRNRAEFLNGESVAIPARMCRNGIAASSL